MPAGLLQARRPTRHSDTIGASGISRRLLLLFAAVTAVVIACRGDTPSPTPGPLDRGIAAMEITSPAFEHGNSIPTKYTCDGEDVSPPIKLGTPPTQTRSLALIMDDPNAPGGIFAHWLAFNFDSDRNELEEGLAKASGKVEEGLHGVNDFGRQGYRGPCPPTGPAHTYRFMVYALDRKLELEADTTLTVLVAAMRGNVLGYGILEGTFVRDR